MENANNLCFTICLFTKQYEMHYELCSSLSRAYQGVLYFGPLNKELD